jgi:elongation factor P--(R)-beta-lysine ligase
MDCPRDMGPQGDRDRLARTRPRLEARAAIVRALRLFFEGRGFLEVETPIRAPRPAPERHIEPEPSGDRFLVTSPELHMKRLLAAGYERLFQVCRCFRRAERGARHQPEFTMLEWYRLGEGSDALMRDCEGLVAACAAAVRALPGPCLLPPDLRLDAPWERLAVADAFERHAGWRPGAAPDEDRFDRDLVDKVEPALPRDRAVFLAGYPASMASLARLVPGDLATADRFELYAGGLELANGFAELVDPAEQRRRFEDERALRLAAGNPVWPLDERFLGALELGMRPAAGIALGVDRLVMVLTGAATIDEVVAFPDELA